MSAGKEQEGIVECNKQKSLDGGISCKLLEDKCGRAVLYLDGRNESQPEARRLVAPSCLTIAATRNELIHILQMSKSKDSVNGHWHHVSIFYIPRHSIVQLAAGYSTLQEDICQCETRPFLLN